MPLQIYNEYGFKLFLCRADKTPDITDGKYIDGKWVGDSWKDSKYHITVEQAEYYQSIGRMIGAWIPEGVIIIDLDRHEGKPDGVVTMKGIKEQYDITFDLMSDTFVVSTARRGYHVFFTTDQEFKQNEKAPGIDLKTHKGYVIAAGSPGYTANAYIEPAPLPENFCIWLESLENDRNENEAPELQDQSKNFLSVTKLRHILDNVDITNFRENDKWLYFVMSALAVSGTTSDVIDALNDWSQKDPAYSNDRTVEKRIKSFDEIEKISVGTFLYYLKNEKVTTHQIREIKRTQSVYDIIQNQQDLETSLPFNGIDYKAISETPIANDFFLNPGHTNAAKMLYIALNGKIVYVHGEKKSYYFDGNRWEFLNDPYSVMYTIIFRVSRIIYEIKDDSENMNKIIQFINTLYWKESVWKEFTRQTGIYNDFIQWDGPQNKETLTCIDGVIDFSGGRAIKRNGTQPEYRRYYLEYMCDDIANADKPKKFIDFLDGIFPDKETLETIKYYLSCMISGNASKRIFSIWKGNGRNGKSTLQEIMRTVIGKKLITTFDVGLILQTRDGGALGLTPEQAKLQGTLAAFTSEVDPNQKLNASKIKNLCGDETITANPKHIAPIEFEATWQMILLCNDFPKFNASDNALIDRLLIVPFDIKYILNESERDEWIKKGVKRKNIKNAIPKKSFIPGIFEERVGILRYLIEAYIELETKLNGVIPESTQCKMLKNKYIKDNDDFGIFIEKFCVIDTESDYFTTNTEITDLYRDFVSNKKLSTQYITNGIIKATNDVITKDVRRVKIKDEFGNFTTKQQRGLSFVKIDEYKENNKDKNEHAEDFIPF